MPPHPHHHHDPPEHPDDDDQYDDDHDDDDQYDGDHGECVSAKWRRDCPSTVSLPALLTLLRCLKLLAAIH